MSKEHVSHEGIITKINDDNVEVKILSKGACIACHIKSACNLSEIHEKNIIIPKPENKDFIIGQAVMISITIKQANKAVFFAYLVPAIIVISMISVLSTFHVKEGVNALISVGSLIPYYLILFLFRKKLKSKFEYEIS